MKSEIVLMTDRQIAANVRERFPAKTPSSTIARRLTRERLEWPVTVEAGSRVITSKTKDSSKRGKVWKTT
jgi:hypothetical protein